MHMLYTFTCTCTCMYMYMFCGRGLGMRLICTVYIHVHVHACRLPSNYSVLCLLFHHLLLFNLLQMELQGWALPSSTSCATQCLPRWRRAPSEEWRRPPFSTSTPWTTATTWAGTLEPCPVRLTEVPGKANVPFVLYMYVHVCTCI